MSESLTLNFLSYITTGPVAGDDSILEAAYIRVADGEERAVQSFLARPAGIPLIVRRLTGLDERRVAGRDEPRMVMGRLLAELGGCGGPVVVHDAPAFCSFLEALYLDPPGGLIDSRELAEVILPQCHDFSLVAVAGALQLDVPRLHRGIAMARLTRGVWDRLAAGISGLPAHVLTVLADLAGTAGTSLAGFLCEAADRQAGFMLSDERDSIAGFAGELKDHTHLFEQVRQCETPAPGDESIDTGKIAAMFEADGVIGRNLEKFELRRQQVGMVEAVCEALNHGRHLICEAGTGTGKSMAYLLPAIAWARKNEDRVMVSTNTRNLQEQLYEKDLPFLKQLLGGRFSTAILKGRCNYLCVRRLLHLLRYRDYELSDPADAAALMRLVRWVAETESGDISECAAFSGFDRARSLIQQFTATGDECTGNACPAAGKCFVRRARALAHLADVIVVNHALVFSDVALDRPHLPRERCIIFDEAHNIEDVATEAASVTADELTFSRICRRLWSTRRDGSGSGMIATVIGLVQRHFPSKGPLSADTALEMAEGVTEAAEGLRREAGEFFDMLSEPFASVPPSENRLMLDACRPPVGLQGPAGDAAARVLEGVEKLQRGIKNLLECMEENAQAAENVRELAGNLTGQVNRLKEAAGSLRFILGREGGKDCVYWLECSARGPRRFYRLRAAPLDIGEFLRTFFFDEMRSVILTSATMQVAGKFVYMKQRLGVDRFGPERLTCAAFGSPFDFHSQSRLYVPVFLPDAGGKRDSVYDEELSSFLTDLLRATEGRSLVLFTSYSLLNTVYDRIKRPLESVNIPLLAQGRDGSRRTLIRLFKDNLRSVLLGTQSFWEGVDVLGESLSCLVVTKLPFQVHTEPLVQGRIQHLRQSGIDPFRHYTLPKAVISFRQGFGRLIRHSSDRGVVVVTDRRLVTKAYGRSFLADLNAPYSTCRRKDPLIAGVRRFLGQNK